VVPERPMVEEFSEELIEAATAPELLELRGIIVFGSNGSWVLAAPAVEGESVLTIPPPVVDSALAPLVVCPTCCTNPDAPFVEEPVTVWLMLISWSSWFRDIIWPTIAVESTGAVGS